MFVIVTVASVCSFIFMNIAGLGLYCSRSPSVVAMFCFIPLVGSSRWRWCRWRWVGFAVNPTIGIATIIYFLIYQQFDAYVIYPNVMRRTVKVPGALVVLSAIIGGMLFGVIGAVIAIPTTAVVLLLYREMVQPALETPPGPRVGLTGALRIARCQVDYVGRLTAHLPMATRLILVKADGLRPSTPTTARTSRSTG